MLKKFLIILLSVICLIILTIIAININSDDTNNINTSITNNSGNTQIKEETINSDTTSSNLVENQIDTNLQVIETEISSFSTQIYNKEEGRQNNIQITCTSLNGIIITQGEEFSFCNTVGEATAEKGYMESDIFDNDGNVTRGLGGGNCQVSTTLYNSVLTIPTLEVTERSPHSNTVPYIEERF